VTHRRNKPRSPDALISIFRVEERRRLYRAQRGRCHYCSRLVRLRGPWDDPLAATLDHVVPRALGGPTAPENLVVACRACNQRKGDALVSPGAGALGG
jgi:5-methylcytosine-specific restriction endonuclease McrA